MMSQKFPVLSQIYEYSDADGFDWQKNKLDEGADKKNAILSIIPAPLQSLSPEQITSELDTSFLDTSSLRRELMGIEGIKTLGRRPEVARALVQELKNYFRPPKKQNPFEIILTDTTTGIPTLNYKGEALTLERMKRRNLDLEDLSLNRGIKPKALLRQVKNAFKVGQGERTLTTVQKRNLELLIKYLEDYEMQRRPQRASKKISFTIDDRDIFFGRAGEIEVEDVQNAYDYWEGISNKIKKFTENVEKLIDDMDSSDADMKKFIEFYNKNKGDDFLNYIVEYPERTVKIEDINDRIAQFISDYLHTYNILTVYGDIKMAQHSGEGAKEALEELEYDAGEFNIDDSDSQARDESNIAEAALNKPTRLNNQEAPYDRKAAELEIDMKEQSPDIYTDDMKLDAVSILALKRNSTNFTTDVEIDFFRELAEDKIGDVLNAFKDKGIPFSDEDVENFRGFLGRIKKFEEEKSGMLPVFFSEYTPLDEFYSGGVFGKSRDYTEKITEFFSLLKNAIETQNTTIPQNVNLRLYGMRERARQENENIPASEKPFYERRSKVSGRGGTGNLKRNLDKDLIKDIIEDIEELYASPMDSEYCFGYELPFADTGSMNVLMTYGDSKEFEGINLLYRKLMRDKTAAFRTGDLTKLANSMKQINDGFTNIKNAKRGFEKFVKVLSKAFGVRKGDEYYNTILNDAAAMFGGLKANMGNTENVSLQGVDVDKAYREFIEANSQRQVGFANLKSIRDFKRFFKKRSGEMSFAETFTSDKEGKSKRSAAAGAIKQIEEQIKNLKRRDIQKSLSDKILEVHDSLRLLKKETIYYGRHDLEDYDSMQNMIVKMQEQFSRDISVNELTSIVSEVNAFDDISKSYGISKEEVYFIKANFR